MKLGSILLYILTEYDCDGIKAARAAHSTDGNKVAPGDIVPAVVLRVWGPQCANVRLLLDGPDDYWKTSVSLAPEPLLGSLYDPAALPSPTPATETGTAQAPTTDAAPTATDAAPAPVPATCEEARSPYVNYDHLT